jgi:hypothetical protein
MRSQKNGLLFPGVISRRANRSTNFVSTSYVLWSREKVQSGALISARDAVDPIHHIVVGGEQLVTECQSFVGYVDLNGVVITNSEA